MSGLDDLTKEELKALVLNLHETVTKQQETIKFLEARVAELEAEVAELRAKLGGGNGSGTPDWVKPNRKERRAAERKERKKRKHSFARKRETPTEIIEHTVDTCPDCGRRLSGGWVAKTRQVIEMPEVRVRIIEHRLIARKCGVCGKTHTAKIDLSGQVIGKKRFGIKLMSFVAELRAVCRMPLKQIQGLLKVLCGVHISVGEVSEMLHAVAKAGEEQYLKLRDEIRGSPVVNADETGWRQDGVNGYIWSFSTPKTRYFVYNKSRASDIPREVLGSGWSGRLVCDFYSAYGVLDVICQRCWVHLLRDLKKLKEKHENRADVAAWVEAVRDVYERAKDFRNEIPKFRLEAKMAFERELMALAVPFLGKKKPQSVLAGRIEKFLAELFVFVEEPNVPSDNNAAERSVRPSVIARKISGGTRSEKGSKTRMILMSLFGTWKLRGLDTISECRNLLAAHKPIQST
ncbi:MAG TPA: IS66 family transposase [Armatimonadota bacterium]|jgi:transposase|nr:IS66 family transposase [Armatimonadota bacterium]